MEWWLQEKKNPTNSSILLIKEKEKAENAPRTPSLSLGYDFRDLNGLDQRVDKDFGINSMKTLSKRNMQAKNRPLGKIPIPTNSSEKLVRKDVFFNELNS